MNHRANYRMAGLGFAVFAMGIMGAPLRVEADDVAPGNDCFRTTPGSGTEIVFGTASTPTIPADFFGPGSDPFSGAVRLKGVDLGDPYDGADTVVRRLDAASLPQENGSCTVEEVDCGNCTPSNSCAIVSIEVIELSLASEQPITVTFNGGATSKEFSLAVELSPSGTSGGNMRIVHKNAAGGSYYAKMDILVQNTFTEVGNPGNSFVLDTGMEPGFSAESNDCVEDGTWSHSAANFYGPGCDNANFGIILPCLHDGPHPKITTSHIPTVSEWGLIVLTLLGLAMGTIFYSRKRAVRC